MQRDEYATAPKHDSKIHGRDAHKMLKSSTEHGKNAYGKQISDSEINTCMEFQIRLHSSEQQNYMLQDLNMAK